MEAVTRQRIGKHVPAANEYTLNNTVTIGNNVFYSVRVKGL
jgi:hypothetical protein